MSGCIDIYTSRRTAFEKCRWWARDDDEVDLETYAHENKPSGSFYAKEANAFANEKGDINGIFLYDENTITLETQDAVDVKAGDIVEFDGELWHALNVQKREFHKSKQYFTQRFFKTYMQLKR